MSWPTAMKRKPWRASSTARIRVVGGDAGGDAVALAGIDDRGQRGGVARMVELAGDAHRGREVEVSDPQHVDPLGGRDRVEVVDRADGLDHRDDHQLVVGPAHVARDVTLVLVDVEDPEAAVALRRVLRGGDHRARLGGVADQRHHHSERAEREHAADRVVVERAHADERHGVRRARGGEQRPDLVEPPARVLLVEDDELRARACRRPREPGRVEVDREHPEDGLALPQPAQRGVRPHAVLPRASTGQTCVDLAVAHRVQAIGQVHACAGVDRDERKALADGERAVEAAHEPVLLGHALDHDVALDGLAEPAQRQAGAADDAGVARERLRAAVDRSPYRDRSR